MGPKLPEHFEKGDLVITTNERFQNLFDYNYRWIIPGQLCIVTEVDWSFETLKVKRLIDDQLLRGKYLFKGFNLIKKGPKVPHLIKLCFNL